jgi:hypothetical protein
VISPLKYFLEWSLMARIAQIVSTARYLPEHIVTNAELTARFAALGRPDVINKLGARTGIKHVWRPLVI